MLLSKVYDDGTLIQLLLLQAGFLIGWFSTLEMEAIRFSETLVRILPTPRYIHEDSYIKKRC
jgi:hypothetical protein